MAGEGLAGHDTGTLTSKLHGEPYRAELDTMRERLEEFEIDGAERELSFTQRLAMENGWSIAYAERVVAEYKRFLLLGCMATHPVTPSDAVDQAWHLHLTYSRSYWDSLCRGVLGRSFHHDPTAGGPAERAKFRGLYEQTLGSYRSLLGSSPPLDIWPQVEHRFGDAAFVRVDAVRHWIVSKYAVKQALLKLLAFVAAGFFLYLLFAGALVHAKPTDTTSARPGGACLRVVRH